MYDNYGMVSWPNVYYYIEKHRLQHFFKFLEM